MSLEVVEMRTDTSGLRVVVRSGIRRWPDAIDELNGPDSARLAVKHASENGIPDARLGGAESAYPVDQEGKPIGFGPGSPPPIAEYRRDFVITRSLASL